jgi:hypothetical protein
MDRKREKCRGSRLSNEPPRMLLRSCADRRGLGAPLWIASAGAIVVAMAGLFMNETAPAKR